jgi:hypothetical protein
MSAARRSRPIRRKNFDEIWSRRRSIVAPTQRGYTPCRVELGAEARRARRPACRRVKKTSSIQFCHAHAASHLVFLRRAPICARL